MLSDSEDGAVHRTGDNGIRGGEGALSGERRDVIILRTESLPRGLSHHHQGGRHGQEQLKTEPSCSGRSGLHGPLRGVATSRPAAAEPLKIKDDETDGNRATGT